MYTVTATIFAIDSKNEGSKIIMPIIYWMFATLFLFCVAMQLKTPFWFILFILCFLSLVPVTIIIIKRAKAYRKNYYENKQVVQLVLNVKDGVVYKDGMSLSVFYDDLNNLVYLDHYAKKSVRYSPPDFSATVENPAIDGLLNFLKENNVEVLKADR